MTGSFRWRRFRDNARETLWLLPGATVVVAVLLGTTLSSVDVPEGSLLESMTFGGGPEGARQLLVAIIGAMITVTGTVFSITIVALQLASSQYSPRLLRQFLRDRPTQLTLSVFLGTFAYSLAVLRTIRAGEDEELLVPPVAVTVAVVGVLLAVAALVHFIHHITQSIRVETILSSVHDDTLALIDETYPDELDEEAGPIELPQPPDSAVTLAAQRSGHLQAVALDRLAAVAERHGICVLMNAMPGEYVVEGTTLAWAWPLEAGGPLDESQLTARLAEAVSIGDERTMQQDVTWALHQLVDIAVKAMSTGMNDPTTARQAVGPLSSLLVRLSRRRLVHTLQHDAEGTVRVAIPRPDFDSYLSLAVDPIRRYASEEPAVLRNLLRLLNDVGSATPSAARRQTVCDAIDRIVAAAEHQLALPFDRDAVLTLAAHARRTVIGDEQPEKGGEDS